MTTPLPNQRDKKDLQFPLPDCYHGGNPFCEALCGHGPKTGGLLAALQNDHDLALRIEAHYFHQRARLFDFIFTHEPCLFPQDTDRSSASNQPATSDPIPSLPPEPKEPSGI